MSKFFKRVEGVRDSLQDLIDLCNQNPREFFRCDELQRALHSIYAEIECAILDEPAPPTGIYLPRLATLEMRHGLSEQYDEEIPRKTAYEWYVSQEVCTLPPGVYHLEAQFSGDAGMEKLMGFLPLPHEKDITLQDKFYRTPMKWSEYERMAILSMRHYAMTQTKERNPDS